VLLEQYLPIGILILLSTIIGLIAAFFSRILGPHKPSVKKQTPYESGMTPIGPAVRRLPVRFYLVAVIFILFDIEVVFLFPWAVIFRQLRLFGLIEMAVFVAILLVGYIYLWRKGALEWE